MAVSPRKIAAKDNPFRSSSVGKLEFVGKGITLEELWLKFIAMGCRASIVGPHGCGKTTLAQALKTKMLKAAYSVQEIRGSRLASGEISWSANASDKADIRIVDGWDMLPYWKRLYYLRSGPLLAVSHRPIKGLSVLYKAEPDLGILKLLLTRLGLDLDESYLLERFKKHEGNAREVFRELYDEFAERSALL